MIVRQPCGHEGLCALGFYPVHCQSGWRLRAFSLLVLIEFVPFHTPIYQYITPARRPTVSGKQTPRQTTLLSHRLLSLFSLPPKPFSGCRAACIPCTKHTDVAVMPGAAAAGVPPASSPAHPAVTVARRGHAAHHPIGLAGPAPIRPQGLPLVSLYPRAVTAPRFATGLSRPWDSGFFILSLRLPGDLTLLGRSEAGLTSHRLRGVADDRFAATALPLRLVVPFLCPRPGRLRFAQTALAGVIAATAVSRAPLRSGRDTAPRRFF